MVSVFDIEFDMLYYIFKILIGISLASLGIFLTFFFRLDHDLLLFLHGRFNHSNYYKGKKVWITGGSSGIGEYLAYELTQQGAKVAISARRQDALQKVAQSCRPEAAIPIVMDQLDLSSHESILQQVIDKLGGLDIIVINAGRSQRALAEETELQVTRDIFELNVISYINLTKLVIPYFKKQGHGSIVVTSSVSGKFGATLSSSYSMTKHALHGYYNALRTEVSSYGINVTIVCPGPIKTAIISNAFSKSASTAYNNANTADEDAKMSPVRHAILMSRAIAAKQDETWISQQPVLFFTYLSQYSPVVWNHINAFVARFRIRAYKRGVESMSLKNVFQNMYSNWQHGKSVTDIKTE